MATAGRIQEAEKHLAEAQKCIKTGLLKWSPDYAGAASSYDKAAICFRNSRDYAGAKDAYMKAAECHYNNHAIYHSGKSIEQAANVARDSKQPEEAAKLYQRASERYNESGHPDTAGQTLMKGAQLLQHENPGLAAKYFLATADYYELDEKIREAANSIKNAVRMYCRTRPRQYDQIIETARLSRTSFLRAGAINMAHEAISVEIIAMLMKGQGLDSLEVLQEANSIPEFSSSEERSMLEQLIDAVNQKDDETIKQSCDSGIFRSMDPEFAKLARDLKAGSDSVDPVKQEKQKNVTKSSSKEPSKAQPSKDVKKKNAAELADARNQLFTKSTGEKTSSKMPKPRSAYKSTPPPVSDERPNQPVIPETRGLEEEPPQPPKEEEEERVKDEPQEKDVSKEEDVPTGEEGVGEEDDKEGGVPVVEDEVGGVTKEENQGEEGQEVDDDDDDEPIDFN